MNLSWSKLLLQYQGSENGYSLVLAAAGKPPTPSSAGVFGLQKKPFSGGKKEKIKKVKFFLASGPPPRFDQGLVPDSGNCAEFRI